MTQPATARATLSSVASSTTSQQVLPANSLRRGVIAHNSDANPCWLKYGSIASTTSYTYRIDAGGHWEMPQPIYSGRIDVIWATDGDGALYVTET